MRIDYYVLGVTLFIAILMADLTGAVIKIGATAAAAEYAAVQLKGKIEREQRAEAARQKAERERQQQIAEQQRIERERRAQQEQARRNAQHEQRMIQAREDERRRLLDEEFDRTYRPKSYCARMNSGNFEKCTQERMEAKAKFMTERR